MEICQWTAPNTPDRRATADAAASRAQPELARAMPWVRPLNGAVGLLHARVEPLHQRGAAAKQKLRRVHEIDGTAEQEVSTVRGFDLGARIIRVHCCTKKIDACTPSMDARMSGVRRRSKKLRCVGVEPCNVERMGCARGRRPCNARTRWINAAPAWCSGRSS